jgi:hypothetical protein
LEWIGCARRMDQGKKVKKNFRVNRREVEEGKNLD